jgi:heptosyltransferase-1
MQRIAIVKLSAMGDIIHAMVVLEFIKKVYPDLKIDWIVEEGFKGVLEKNPYIDQILPLNLKKLKRNKLALFSEIKKIKKYSKNNYDLVIDAQGLLKSAIVSKLLGKRVAGFDRNSSREGVSAYFYHDRYTISYALNKIDRNALLFSHVLALEITRKDILKKQPLLYHDRYTFDFLDKHHKNILLVISSSWESKNYPKERFLELTQKLDACFIVVWADEKEKEIATFVKGGNERVYIPERLSLDALKSLISQVDLVIGNDTGPTHMAWALNRPSITLFGPTPLEQTYLTPINKALKSPSDVDPYKLNRKDFSIKEIAVDEIVVLAKELLS